ncbi:acyltransferase [uncultured Alcanivorax sp.]|jgi:acetyltransferase-like isoleucine patch superfamily enzyme|uniref:acyltransferase n=1 Tax=uncultured Alcanivorax sp. TaxID=191215 RepID=UPI0032B11BC8
MIRKLLARLGGEGFGSEDFPILLLLRFFIVQKIIGLNRKVSWPVHWTSRVTEPTKIVRGTRCPGMSMGCHIDGRNGIVFGRNVWVGPRVSIISMNHDINDYEEYVQESPVIIGDNCWLGANSVILPGVEIGDHTVVAAGSVVTKSFPGSDQIIAGVPAKVIKRLAPYGKKNDR